MELNDNVLDKIIRNGVIDALGLEDRIKSTPISEIMTTNFSTLNKNGMVRNALSQMLDNGTTCIIAEEDKRPAGILTLKDVSRLVLEDRDISGLKIEEVMNSPVRTIQTDATDYDAIRIMAREEVSRLVVTDEDRRIAGLVTYSYLCRGLEKESVQSLKDAVMERERGLRKTEEELNDMTVYIDNILGFSTETAVVAADLDLRIKYYNNVAESIYGLKAGDIIGKTVIELLKIKNVPSPDFERAIEAVREKGEYEFSIKISSDGRNRFFTNKISYIKNKNGEAAGYVCFSNDITDRIHMENALLEGGRTYRSLFEDSPVSLWEEDWSWVKAYIDGLRGSGVKDLRKYFIDHTEAVGECGDKIKIIDVNKATVDLYGAGSKDELKGGLNRIITEESYAGLRDVLIAIAEGKTKFECETVNRTMKGERKNISLKWNVVPGYERTYSKVLVSITDITHRRKVEDNLIKEKMFSESIINSLPGTFCLFNEQGEILRWNKNLENITGYSSEEIYLMDPIDLIAEEDRGLVLEGIKEVFERGQANIEAHFAVKDGSRVPFFCTGKKILLDNRTCIIGVGMDITYRKQAEEKIRISLEENELLLKEIHHRVKNNLQIICSLFNLQKSSIKDRDAFEMVTECQNRIRAIALVHEKLYQSRSLANIDLREYIDDLLHNVFTFYEINPNRIRLKTAIDSIPIDVNSAIPCGLIVNELAANSLQYAFPGEKEGEISVSVYLTDMDKVNIIIKDNGVNLSHDYDIISNTLLGLQITDALIKQLDGTIEIQRGNGTEFHITFRLKK